MSSNTSTNGITPTKPAPPPAKFNADAAQPIAIRLRDGGIGLPNPVSRISLDSKSTGAHATEMQWHRSGVICLVKGKRLLIPFSACESIEVAE